MRVYRVYEYGPCTHRPPPPGRVLSTKVDVNTYDALVRIAETEDRTVSYVAARILADAVADS